MAAIFGNDVFYRKGGVDSCDSGPGVTESG